MKKVMIIIATVVILLVTVVTVFAYYEGEVVKIEENSWGYYNPWCYGTAGFWWDFTNPTDYYYYCDGNNRPVKYSGLGTVEEHSEWKTFDVNGTIRVCMKDTYGCRWFPQINVVEQ